MRQHGSLIYVGIAGMVVLFFLAGPGSQWLSARLTSHRSETPPVGRLLSFEGQIKRIHDGQVEIITAPLEKPLTIYSRERLEVDASSKAILQLNSNDEFELPALTAVSLQLWNERDPASAVYMTVIAGSIELKKAGVKGKAYVVREGRLYLPGQNTSGKPAALTVLRNAPLEMDLASSEGTTPPTEFEEFEDEKSAAASAPLTEPETLSNEYIDGMIAGRQSQLQKCWILRLKDNPELKGQLVLQFEISRRGKIMDVKVADSTIEDDALKKCVIDVIERISLRPFKGPEISLTYPITFE